MNSTLRATLAASDDNAAVAVRAVLLVGPLPPPSGGMANQTRQLAGLLADEGMLVSIAQVNATYRPAWIGHIRGIRALFRLVPYLFALWRVARSADLIHVMANSGWAWYLFAAPAVWIGALRRVPVVVNYRGGDADAFFARAAARVTPTLRRASAIIVPSGFLQAVFAKYGIATTIVPNIVDLERFQPAETLPAAPHILVTRNLEPIYDIGTVIRAFAKVRKTHSSARLTVAGSGPERSSLEQAARDLAVDDAVTFTGRVDNSALPAVYRSASVVANASRVDNMPISLLEAMASGVPIVSTRVGGVPFLVEHDKTALLVPVADFDAMADAMLRLIGDSALAARLRDNGLRAATEYAWLRVRPRLLEVYAKSMAGRARGERPLRASA